MNTKQNNRRMIYDITQLAHWSGNITGIPRVMQELAVRFRREDPQAIFVVWVKELEEYCEVNLEQTLAHRGHGIAYLNSGDPTPEYDGDLAPDNSSLATDNVPNSKLTLKKVAKAGISRSSRVNKRLSDVLERKAKRWQIDRYKQVEYHKGDRLFIPWGEWYDPRFIAKLEHCHSRGVKLVQVLHDMSPVVVPQYSNSGNATETFPVYMGHILPKSDLVLAVSENSKQDALKWLKEKKLPVPRFEVFRTGDDIKVAHPHKPDNQLFKDSELKGNDFIMCVGTIELKKNHMLFYYVYKLAKTRGIKLPKLVIAGRRGWMTEATYELMTNDPDVKDQIIFQLDKSDEILSWLYSHCMFTVLPSFYEGWGIPIAESLARGVPCLCSNTSSMTEVGKGFTEHFSPASSDECLAAIQRWLNPAKLEEARKRTQQYKPFTWDESYFQVKKYMEKIS